MIKRLSWYLKAHWFRLSVALICMSGVAAISTGMMWLMKFLIDSALVSKDFDALQTGMVLVISSFALKGFLWYSHTYLTSYVGQSISRQLRDQVYAHLYTLSMGFFNERTSSGLLSRLTNDVTTLQGVLRTAPTSIFRDGLTVIGLIGFLFYSNWKFALICFSILPLAAFVITFLGKKSRKAGRESQEKMAELYGTIQEALMAMPIVKTFQNEQKEIKDFKESNLRYFDVIMKLVRVEARSSPIMELIGSFILALMLGVGGRDVIQGNWSMGGFVAFIGAAMSLYNPIKQFANVNIQLQQGLAAAERVFHILDQKPTVLEDPNAVRVKTLSDNIEFQNVTFSYSPNQPVLRQIQLTIKKGDIVALVGPSGSGKSTLAQLLLRFYDPAEGKILMDGLDYRTLNVESLRRQLAVVTQETHLFNDSLYNNIAYGRPDCTPDDVVSAARSAYADDFIKKLPNGYETIIGERGTRLSGGERQRIAIARALLKNPPILILDEATSALDAESERMVQQALDRLLQGRTVLMIAHRLATIRKANRIVVIENGSIRESGNHEDLLQQKGLYHRLVELQSFAG